MAKHMNSIFLQDLKAHKKKMDVFSHMANNYIVSMSKGAVLCCPLGFRHCHCESFPVKRFGGLILLVCLSIFLFGLFVSHQLCDFWSNFSWLEVLSFSQPNCMRGATDMTLLHSSHPPSFLVECTESGGMDRQGFVIGCSCFLTGSVMPWRFLLIGLISEMLMNCILMDTIYLSHAFRNGKPAYTIGCT